VSLPRRGASEWSAARRTDVRAQISPLPFYTTRLGTTNFSSHSVLSRQPAYLQLSHPSHMQRANAKHAIAKPLLKDASNILLWESTSHLEDTSRKPEFGTSGSPSVPDYSVEYYLQTDDKAKFLKPSRISASKPVGSNKVAIAKFSRQAKGSVPPCRPLVVRRPVSALQTMLTTPQEPEARLEFNATGVTMSTHLAITHVTGVA